MPRVIHLIIELQRVNTTMPSTETVINAVND